MFISHVKGEAIVLYVCGLEDIIYSLFLLLDNL